MASLGRMCGRYSLSSPDADLLRRRFEVGGSREFPNKPRFNIAPTDPVPAVRETARASATSASCAGAWSRGAGQSRAGGR